MTRPAVARIHLAHLRHNYRLLKQRAGSAEVMAVVKADAYGHGLHLVAPTLRDEGCESFAVTDAKEGARLRDMLSEGARIAVLSGVYDAEDARLCSEKQLTPVLVRMEQIQLLRDAGFDGAAWIKVDTGMNRIGALRPAEMIASLNEAGMRLAGIMSHLACADTPEHPMNRAQLNAFIDRWRSLAPDAPASLLNSAGLIAMPEHAFDVVRPGIALYGAEPIASAPIGLKPVMQLMGGILQLRDIKAGETVSYGASYLARRDMRVAVVSLGYADGVPRALSNRGSVVINGRACPIIGRVCMDYTLVDVSGCDCAEGDMAEFWGEALPANQVAESIDTISYALFTGVGERVLREGVR